MKCCFCGAELNDYPDKTTGVRMAVCRNPKCKYDGWHFPIEITQRMIDGKKAQEALKVAIDALSNIDAFNCHDKGAIEIMARMVSVANGALYEITSVTKQGE